MLVPARPAAGPRSEARTSHRTESRDRTSEMLRVRRHRAVGTLLLALLAPLLAAGPGMPCAGMATGHHEGAGHVVAEGHVVPDDAPATHEHHAHGTVHARSGGSESAPAHGTVLPVGDDAPPTPSPAPCTMGMLCSGTVLAAASVAIPSTSVEHALADADARWTLHTSDLSLPRRPPRA